MKLVILFLIKIWLTYIIKIDIWKYYPIKKGVKMEQHKIEKIYKKIGIANYNSIPNELGKSCEDKLDYFGNSLKKGQRIIVKTNLEFWGF